CWSWRDTPWSSPTSRAASSAGSKTQQGGGRPGLGRDPWAGASSPPSAAAALAGALLHAGPHGLDEQPRPVVVHVLPDMTDHIAERDAALRVAEAERPAASRMAERARAAERGLLRREHVSRRETGGYQQDPVGPAACSAIAPASEAASRM